MIEEIVIEKQNPSIYSIAPELIFHIASFLEKINDINNFSHSSKYILDVMQNCPMEFNEPILNGISQDKYKDYLEFRHLFYGKKEEIEKITPSNFFRFYIKNGLFVDITISISITLSISLGIALSGYSNLITGVGSTVGGLVSIMGTQGMRFFYDKKIKEADNKITTLQAELTHLSMPVLN